jgi:VWFA-related protein
MMMSPKFVRSSGLIVLALALSAGVLAAQRQTVFRAAQELVRVYVTVTDQAGRLVTTLERGAFEIRDDGSQPIVAFDNTPTPIRIVVLLDVSASMEGTLPLLQKAASELFVRLRPDDLARVGYFGTKIVLAPRFTRDVAELRASLPCPSFKTSIDPRQCSMRGEQSALKGTVLWRALAQSMQLFDAATPERPVILVLSDGKDSDPFQSTRVTITDVIDRAQRTGVMIYSIGVESGSPDLSALERAPDPGLRRVADETGGGYLEVTKRDDLAAAFARVADELHSQYLLGYVPPKADGKEHKIGVRVSGPGLRARARRTYVAPREESK